MEARSQAARDVIGQVEQVILGNTGEKTDLTSTAILWYIIVAMEEGLFFMPKFRHPVRTAGNTSTLRK